ncbi:hypothetical protein LWI28_008357 [Acer negundo]|uniref:Retrovirus-related Pol polyprotein from transposon TNT 1-94-like beta-barrel domain-containing protein n=1 Tax=Acer negundo TaxID=4023 RepID=A0AAD5IGE5_ACENE|nr:hypothetical protein LWI28_008357 [Acer negundo]
MCARKEMFLELDDTFTPKVKFGNNSKVLVIEKGTISISLKVSSKNTISEILFVPTLYQNPLSMGATFREGDVTFDEQGCWDWSYGKESSIDIDVDQDEIDGHPIDDPVLTLVALPSLVNPHPVESSCRPQRERVLLARL